MYDYRAIDVNRYALLAASGPIVYVFVECGGGGGEGGVKGCVCRVANIVSAGPEKNYEWTPSKFDCNKFCISILVNS